MALEIGNINVQEIAFGDQTRLRGKRLLIAEQKLREHLKTQDQRIAKVTVSLVRPGEACRIICVKDVIEPWCKVSGSEPGSGRNHRLKNVAVVTCGRIVGFQEGIIDMSGPGARHTPFSETLNVILEIAVDKALTAQAHEEVIRHTGLTAARFLGEAARAVTPDEILTFDAPAPDRRATNRPRIAYLYLLLNQGLMHDSYLFGENAKTGLPRAIAPHLLLDNAIVSGNCVSACDKNTTWHHQNNPLLQELYRDDGREFDFVGVVLSPEPTRLSGKEDAAKKAIALLQELQPDGVIISKEGFGNPDADQMMLIRGLEEAGIKTCALTDEFAGPDGLSQSLADATPKADAMVSTGNANQRILLPPMPRIIGPLQDLRKLAGAYPQSLKDDGSLEIELQGIIGATNELGTQRLSAREV